jgi:hypothetical protein
MRAASAGLAKASWISIGMMVIVDFSLFKPAS